MQEKKTQDRNILYVIQELMSGVTDKYDAIYYGWEIVPIENSCTGM